MLAVLVQVSAVPWVQLSLMVRTSPDTVAEIAPAVESSTVILLEMSRALPVEADATVALKVWE